MAVNIKMGVDTSGFKQSITDANAQLKTLDAQLKLADATMKATGNSEQGLVTKTNALSEKLKTQKQMIQQYEKALENMRNAGVDPLSKEYQKMEAALLNTKTGLVETETALNGLTNSEQQAATGADKLTQSVSNIGKKISLDQVINGINKITSGMENAAKHALNFGKNIAESVLEGAQWADDLSTDALIYQVSREQLQRMKYAESFVDTSTETIVKAQRRTKNAIADMSKDTQQVLKDLRVGIREGGNVWQNSYTSIQMRDAEDIFWDIGDAIYNLTDAYKQEDYAQKVFGRSWSELIPLFAAGREEYNKFLSEAPVLTDEEVDSLNELQNAWDEMQAQWETTKRKIEAALAPTLTTLGETLSSLLEQLNKYLESEKGQEMLESLGTAVSGLFEDLGKIDPEKVVEGFAKVFTDIVGGVQWIVDNKEGVFEALKWIVGAWGTLEIAGGVLDIVKVVGGLKDLVGVKEAGAAVGSAWGSSFASAVLKAAPWLVGLIALLNPAESQDNSLMGANGITQEGYYEFARQGMEDKGYKSFLMELGTYFGAQGMSSLMGNAEAVTEIWNYLINGKAGYNTQGFVNNVLGKYTGQTFGSDWLGVDYTEEQLNELLQSMNPVLTPTFIVPENAAETISEEVGTVQVPVDLIVHKEHRGGWTGFDTNPDGNEANGIWSVPFDGFLARLHKGERVVPAREVAASRNFSSNLYVESMYMSGGADAEGLASAMAAAQRRTMSGYGS